MTPGRLPRLIRSAMLAERVLSEAQRNVHGNDDLNDIGASQTIYFEALRACRYSLKEYGYVFTENQWKPGWR